ncbi:MAG: hypothetical protein M3Y42_10530 [Actinomycetota bacterium]|nr:hypothetical protein [Actinomycetota bacterium]MDQ2957389.1 hypothetical protein [Actinomycetota bacterium]
MATTMWEVPAAAGRLAELLDWVLARIDPSAQVYRSSAGQDPAAGEDRVVVIDPTGQAASQLAELPSELAARPAHAWNFDTVRND